MNDRLLEAVLRTDLSSFIAKAFGTVNPGQEFVPNWHIGLIAEHLLACQRGEITRLIVNMPPRMLKSQSISVAWPAWVLGHDPCMRMIAASYSSALAVKHSVDCRRVMQSGWYRRLFPETVLARGENEKQKFSTTRQGYRLAASVGGMLTGEGGNILILDDPLNARQAQSRVAREAANNWVRQTFLSRLDDKRTGVVVVVMQRLHEEDVTGHLLAQAGHQWVQVRLPAVGDETQRWLVGGKEFVQLEGEPLQAEREGHGVLARAQAELGSQAFAAQYMQQPVPQQGGMFRPQWFRRYRQLPLGERVVHSWDTAIKNGEQHDYSVCTQWRVDGEGNAYLVQVERGKWEYPELKRRLLEVTAQGRPDAILLEDKASGQSLLQDVKREGALPLIAVMPQQDKVTRAARASAMVEAGKVWLPEQVSGVAWLGEFERECYAFPATGHDDQVDSMVQCLLWVKDREMKAQMRWL